MPVTSDESSARLTDAQIRQVYFFDIPDLALEGIRTLSSKELRPMPAAGPG